MMNLRIVSIGLAVVFALGQAQAQEGVFLVVGEEGLEAVEVTDERGEGHGARISLPTGFCQGVAAMP